jgi:hypothetical protein
MRKLGIVLVSLVSMSLLFSAPAMAMNWSIGGNLGYEMVMPTEKGADNINLFGWPNATLLDLPFNAPAGLRVGFIGEKPDHEVYLLSAVSVASSGGESISSYAFSANYQYNFSSKGPMTPYVTAGGGMIGFSAGGESATATVFGGGVGVSHKLGAQGRIRAEARFDRGMENKDKGIPALNHISVRLGFDLWGK